MTAHDCLRCGNCCRVDGDVHLRPPEIDVVAAYLGMSVYAFTDAYTRLARDRRRLRLSENTDGACVFLCTDGRCRIHAVKPRQCRDFPEKWTIEEIEQVCAGRQQRQASPRTEGQP